MSATSLLDSRSAILIFALTTSAFNPLSPVAAGEFVLPPASRDADSGGGATTLTDAIRLQDCYDAILFPKGPIRIKELRFRPGTLYGGTFTSTVPNLVVSMSTTHAQPESLSANFASNFGVDKMVVFSGPIGLSSAFTSTNGAKVFDIRIPLNSPFAYNSSEGNLLVEFKNISGSSATFIDAAGIQGDHAGRAFALGAESASASTVDTGVDVIEFIYDAGFDPRVFDLQRDFSTNSSVGVWSYGYKTTIQGLFFPYQSFLYGGSDTGIPLALWCVNPGGGPSSVYQNTTTNTAYSEGNTVAYPPKTTWFSGGYAGNPDNFGAIRLTIPPGAGGTYRLESSVLPYLLDNPNSGDADFHIVKNGSPIYEKSLQAHQGTAYTNSLNLAAGDTIDFLAGRGADDNPSGSGFRIFARLTQYDKGVSLLNVDFGSAGEKEGPAAAGLGTEDFWNAYDFPFSSFGVLTNMLYSDRSFSAVGLIVENAPGSFSSGAADPMLDSYVFPHNGGNIVLTITNLPTGSYEFYVYGHGALDSQNGIFRLDSEGSIYGPRATTTNSDWKTTNWVEGSQYVLFGPIQVTAGSPVTITSLSGASGYAVLNGLQIKGAEPRLIINPKGGLFTNSVEIQISQFSATGVIHFTLDDREPTWESAIYTGSPLVLSNSAVIKAAVFVGTNAISPVESVSFRRVYALDDGVPNVWRLQYFGPDYLTDPRVPANADPDGDGASNLQEYLAGTNPLDANSVFKLRGIRLVPAIDWDSVPNTVYQVLRKDAGSTNWSKLQPTIRAVNTISTFPDITATNASGLYRVEILP
jgi:hypothetical protein